MQMESEVADASALTVRVTCWHECDVEIAREAADVVGGVNKVSD